MSGKGVKQAAQSSKNQKSPPSKPQAQPPKKKDAWADINERQEQPEEDEPQQNEPEDQEQGQDSDPQQRDDPEVDDTADKLNETSVQPAPRRMFSMFFWIHFWKLLV